MNRLRLLVLLLGPLPIIGSSWAVSTWFKSEPREAVMRNSLLPSHFGEWAVRSATATREPDPDGLLDRQCARKAVDWESQLGSECQMLVRPPFVLAGDYHRDELAELFERTIAPAVRTMCSSYFRTEPDEPVSVLVFRSEASYTRYCETLFGERGISIYGYYKPKLRTLVLNLGTGHGTLLHELTHALADFDFPQMPAWLNEGLASLHEQSRFRAGPDGPWIEGLVNWRLEGLQEVIRAGQLHSLAEMLQNPDFRGPREGTNYAQARYFCLYLQERGVLEDFYRSFRDRCDSDPRGLTVLAELLPETSPGALDDDFQQWVLELPSE